MNRFLLRCALCLLFGAALRTLAAAAPDLDAKKQDLQQIELEKKRVQQDLKGLEKNEHSTLKQLEGLNRSLDARRRDLKTNRQNHALVEKRLAELRTRMAEEQAAVDQNRAMLKKELRAMYQAGPLKAAELLLSSSSPAELMSRSRYLRTLAAHNAARLDEIRRNLDRLARNRGESEVRRVELEKRKVEVETARLQEAAEKAKREALLEDLRKKKSRSLQLLKELEESKRQLEGLLTKLQGERKQAAPRKRSSGKGLVPVAGPSKLGKPGTLPWPVKGKVVSRFGRQKHPLAPTLVFNHGIEIAAPLGTPVRSIAEGTVVYADYFDGYGQMIILDHGDDHFSVYGHNSVLSVKPGDRVARGQAIAEVGDSSVLKRSALYLEIRAQAKPVNPLEWLSR